MHTYSIYAIAYAHILLFHENNSIIQSFIQEVLNAYVTYVSI